jgi:hypothetical protein
MEVINMLEKELEVGKFYLDGHGDRIKITHEVNDNIFPCRSNELGYTKFGSYVSNDFKSKMDLVIECTEINNLLSSQSNIKDIFSNFTDDQLNFIKTLLIGIWYNTDSPDISRGELAAILKSFKS